MITKSDMMFDVVVHKLGDLVIHVIHTRVYENVCCYCMFDR